MWLGCSGLVLQAALEGSLWPLPRDCRDPSKGQVTWTSLTWSLVRKVEEGGEFLLGLGLTSLYTPVLGYTSTGEHKESQFIYKILKSQLVIYILTPILPLYTCTSRKKINF